MNTARNQGNPFLPINRSSDFPQIVHHTSTSILDKSLRFFRHNKGQKAAFCCLIWKNACRLQDGEALYDSQFETTVGPLGCHGSDRRTDRRRRLSGLSHSTGIWAASSADTQTDAVTTVTIQSSRPGDDLDQRRRHLAPWSKSAA